MLLAANTYAQSNTPKVNGVVQLRWIDSSGHLYQKPVPIETQWVWSKASAAAEVDSPALRVKVLSRLPADWTAVKTVAENMTTVEALQRRGVSQTLTLDLRALNAVMRIKFIDSRKKEFEMSLVAKVTVQKPVILARKECDDAALHLVASRENGHHLFIGLNCVEERDKIRIQLFRSNDMLWQQGMGLANVDELNKFTSFSYQFDKPKAQEVYAQTLLRVGTVDSAGAVNNYSIFYNPQIIPSRFYANVKLGVTHYSYREEIGAVKLTQISLTPTVNLAYRVIPKDLELALSAFGNVAHLYYSAGAQLQTARWYGVNARLGYRLPFGLGATNLYFLTGWYLWGMSVDSGADPKSFGIKALNGPQLYFMASRSQAGHAGYRGYFKFAMIGDAFSVLAPSNREIAIGGAYEILNSGDKPLALTLDIANIHFAKRTPVVSNSMSLTSVTLGIQKSI